MSELEDEIERLRSRNAELREILEAVERESGWVPKDAPMPEFIRELRKALVEEKEWSEELAKDLCEMEDALGFKQDCTDKDGAFVPTKGPWKERVRDLIAKEGELEDTRQERDAALKAVAEMREAIESLWPHCDLKAFGGSKPRWLIHALSNECGKGYVKFDVPQLHPLTVQLVLGFAKAMADKLSKAERKYGYSVGWATPDAEDWPDPICYEKLAEHIFKGDPRDVANYCAFLWFHKLSTAPALQNYIHRDEVKPLAEAVEWCRDHSGGYEATLCREALAHWRKEEE